MTARRGIVLGGGVAGIVAAFELRDRGFDVSLCERHRGLGGRAFTLPDREEEPAIDNGPHVILGCYDAFRALLRRIGSEHHLARSSRLRLAYRDATGFASSLRLLPGPVPITFPAALMLLGGLGVGGRLRALHGLVASARIPEDGSSFGQWLERKLQQGAPRRYLWDPMCRAILNAEAEDVDAALMLGTLKQAFGGSGARAAIWIPRKPWSEIIGAPALARLREERVDVQFGKRVESIEVGAEAIAALQFADGTSQAIEPDDVVVSTLPWHAFARLLPGVTDAPRLEGMPMVNIAFWCDADPGLPLDPLIALVDGHPFHFFSRRVGEPAGRFALISGGAPGLDGLSTEAITALARAQLGRHFPEARLGDNLRSRVTKEARATLLPRPGELALRPEPGAVPGIANLRIAGDWTRTGLPSTLEGAARSALRALTGL